MKQKASRSNRPKTNYKLSNWSSYNKGLVERGSITFWFDSDTLSKWYYDGPATRGAQKVYSDDAIKVCLVIRQVYHLKLRQTEGFLNSLVRLMNLDIKIPEYSSLSRRMKKLSFSIKPGLKVSDIVFDGTGVKVYGEGEWKVRQHGPGKRRTWRKLYIGLDPDTKQVQAMELTTHSTHDCDAAKNLFEHNSFPHLKRFYGDGGFDKWKVYNILNQLEVEPIIPPQKNARIKLHGNSSDKVLPRDQNIRLIRKNGITSWKQRSGYHIRNTAENFFFRYKTICGSQLKSRNSECQKIESAINVFILNKMIQNNKPHSYKIPH